MERRKVGLCGLILAFATLLSIFVLDRPVAVSLKDSTAQINGIVGPFVGLVEVLFGFPVSKWLTGLILLAIGIALFVLRRSSTTGPLLLFVAVSQLSTRLIAGVLKNVFERPRPYEALAGDEWRGAFFTHGSSFPSGHAAHFWPLFFATAVAFPRYRWPLLVLAVMVSIARVVVNDHYVGDILASAGIAASVVFVLSIVFRNRLARPLIAEPHEDGGLTRR